MSVKRWGIVTGGALGLAAAWSVALLVLGFVAPMYGTSVQDATPEGDGLVSSGTATLVQVNGAWAVVLLCIPLAVTGLVALALRFADRPAARVTAWVLTLLYAGLCVVGLMTIGIFLMPVALALVVACAFARSRATPTPPMPEMGISPVR